MPVDPSYKYVDQVHDKTVAKASEGWRYGCWQSQPSNRVGYQLVQDGWHSDGRRRMIGCASTWKNDPAGKLCGHLASATDPCCEGCSRR